MDTAPNRNGPMTGKRVLITGAASGIGQEIATQLAALGAELVLGCRDRARGEQAAAALARRAGGPPVVVMALDVSSQHSIREFARAFRARYDRLDVLINDAGINHTHRETSVDGVELTLATNVLGYYLLTRELLDLLRASAPARIINVASTFAGDLDLDDLQFQRRRYEGRQAYSQSKACDRLLTWATARRLEGSGVTANAMAPGLVMTGLYRDLPLKSRLIMRVMGLFYGRSVAQGADSAVWLASSPEVEGISGRFLYQRKEIPCEFRGAEAEDTLWRICEELTAST